MHIDNCPRQITYTIKPSDTLYHLARTYNTTVSSILARNPGLDAFNLQIGSQIIICPGESSFSPPMNPVLPPYPFIPAAPIEQVLPHSPFVPPTRIQQPVIQDDKEIFSYPHMDLYNRMRMLWEQHVYWTRMVLISIAERLKDQGATTERLLQNPGDLANIFAKYYGNTAAEQIKKLLSEHLKIGGDLITALRDGETAKADALTKAWYANADQLALAFSSLNPYFDYKDLQKSLYHHLEITTKEVAARLAGKYNEDIAYFNQVEQQALMMSDYFVKGILKQFN